MTNENNNHYLNYYHNFDIRKLLFCFLRKIWTYNAGIKFPVNVLCFFIVLIAIRNIHCQIFNLPRDHFSPYTVGMGFPLLFNIRMKILKYPAIIIGAIACIFQQQWIPVFCLGVWSFMLLLFKDYRVLAIILLIVGITFTMSIFQRERGPSSIIASIQNRIVTYNYTLDNWHNIWLGEGFDTFKTLPENQPFNKDNPYGDRWIRSAHSDLLQGFYELGSLRMVPILLFILLPIAFLRLQSIADYSIFASYLSVLFQGLIDFPFHRWTTGFLGLTIILMMYKQFVFREEKS